MSSPRPTYDELLAENAALRQRVADLKAQLARLTAAWEQAQRSGKRQATPFRKAEQPTPDPKPPGRKPGDAHGTHYRRRRRSSTRPATCPCLTAAPTAPRHRATDRRGHAVPE
jgi:transposase